MNRVIVRAAGVFAAISLSASVALAAPQDKKDAKAASCPVCKMELSKKATDKNTVAVRLKKGGPVMYCCAGCKMPASVLVKADKKGGKM